MMTVARADAQLHLLSFVTSPVTYLGAEMVPPVMRPIMMASFVGLGRADSRGNRLEIALMGDRAEGRKTEIIGVGRLYFLTILDRAGNGLPWLCHDAGEDQDQR